MGVAQRCPLARSARTLRQVEDGAQTFQPLGAERGVGKSVPLPAQGPEEPIPDDRCYPSQSPPAGHDGKKGACDQALGRSRGRLTTKIHLLCDALGRPLRLLLTGGEKAECQQAQTLLAGQRTQAVLAGKGYDTNASGHC